MNGSVDTTIEEQTRAATRRVLELVIDAGEPIVGVDSPPGAGKTWLVESVAATGRHLGLRVVVVTPRAEQAFDLVRRLLRNFGPIPVELMLAKDRTLPPDLDGHPHRLPPRAPIARAAWGHISGPSILVGTVAKMGSFVPDLRHHSFDVLVCDEAYQATYADFAPLFHLARQTLLVGDPGQLPPLVDADVARFEAARYKVHWPAPREILRRFPDAPWVKLPASRRLPPDTADLVQPSFYPDHRFVSVARQEDRRIGFATAAIGLDPVDAALGLLADGSSVVGVLEPEREMSFVDADEEVAERMAAVVARLLDRGAEWVGNGALAPRDIGCVDPHVASGARLREQLRRLGISTDDVMVDTPEIWQGLERPVMVVKHPLSGHRRLDAFGLEPGRWCVALSRHLLGCVIVGRDGIGGAIEEHSHDCAARPMGADDAPWAGRRAHGSVWAELERQDRLVRV